MSITMAYTLHFTCEKIDIAPWAIPADPFGDSTSIYAFEYRAVELDNTRWRFDLVFGDRGASQAFLIDMIGHSLKGDADRLMKSIQENHPTAREYMTAT